MTEVRGADGTVLHTEIHGHPDAPTIVLTHGVLCDLAFWRKQIADLSDEFRVVAFDHRGHGLSDQPARGSYTLDHLADDLHAVLTATVPAGEQAVLAGHSLGGIAVMAWGARYPDDVARRVRSVALVNTTPGEILDNVHFLRGPRRLLGARRRLAMTVAPLAGIPLPRRMPVRRRLLSHVALGSTTVASAGRELDRMIGATSPRGRGGYGGMLVNMVTSIDPSSLDVPALVIAGRRDKIAPPARSEIIAARLPQLIDLREYDTGHCGPLECADEVTASLRALGRGELGQAGKATA
ncbi:alpha/beta fold hydrolase [Nocardia shimofusensis]|uniref:alpha/beta fold hydrolase n=1 Tax=Nocardia shimofusensis TaxID=228596 RepID=UPI000834E73F|nr:alpha/beta hydrolase [Nocardia shimofusensis]